MSYCSKCNKPVYCDRGKFNFFLAILLAFFTGGFGLILYLIIYFTRKPNRCVHCKSVCDPQLKPTDQSTASNNQLLNYHVHPQAAEKFSLSQNQVENAKPKFCYNCGVELGDREGVQFCPFCGSSLSH